MKLIKYIFFLLLLFRIDIAFAKTHFPDAGIICKETAQTCLTVNGEQINKYLWLDHRNNISSGVYTFKKARATIYNVDMYKLGYIRFFYEDSNHNMLIVESIKSGIMPDLDSPNNKWIKDKNSSNDYYIYYDCESNLANSCPFNQVPY